MRKVKVYRADVRMFSERHLKIRYITTTDIYKYVACFFIIIFCNIFVAAAPYGVEVC